MGRVIHFEIHAADPDRAERFYTSVFGWDVQRFGGPVDYRLLKTGPADQPGIDGAILQRQTASGPAEGQPVNAHVCTIGVASLEETERSVPGAGGEQVAERMEVPGVGHLAYFKDTEGNIFGALQPIEA
jgi:predicted enzyme related to lactoylglutathione lyase